MGVSDEKPVLLIATGTRAEWGLLAPVARALRDAGEVRPVIMATNMHLSDRFGHTVDEIRRDGFEPECVPMDAETDGAVARARAAAQCLEGAAGVIADIRPDALLILGDRYEMLSVAFAATMVRVPIIHMHGGEVSEGAIDDSIRHAITKLAHLHLTSTGEYRARVIAMGEDPARVIDTGAIGVANLGNVPLASREEVERELGIPAGAPYVVATFHPATLDAADPAERVTAMLDALDRFHGLHVVLTYPNNDPGSEAVVRVIEARAAAAPDRITLRRSLGLKLYLSAVSHAAAVVGNSSSGIIEVPSAGIPTVDIGIRQRGRAAGPSVIHCGDSTDEIAAALARAISPEMRAVASRRVNPYHKPDTLRLIVDAVTDFVTSHPGALKQFHDA